MITLQELSVSSESKAVTSHTGKVDFSKHLKIGPVPDSPGARLPGYGESYGNCGTVRFKVKCENGHSSLRLNHCDRKDCEICYTTWASKRARIASKRMWWIFENQPKRISGNPRNLRHVTLTTPPEMWKLPYRQVLKWGLGIMKKILRSGGGLYVGHAWRFQDVNGEPVAWKHSDLNSEAEAPIVESWAVYGPHLHFIISGWLIPVDECEARYGCRYTYLSATPTELEVFFCIRYLLTHATILDKSHVIRWFGRYSYNRVVIAREYKELVRAICPICEAPMFYETSEGDWEEWHVQVTRRHYKFRVDQKHLVKKQRMKPVSGSTALYGLKHSVKPSIIRWSNNIYDPECQEVK